MGPIQYTPEIITELEPNQIFVYGSNQFAQHDAGSAKVAHKTFGALYHQAPIGLCGQSYGIITASYSKLHISLEFIKSQVETLYYFAQDLTFYVTKIGTGIAGFSIEQIADIFRSMPFKPTNIILPLEFSKK